MHKEHKAKEWGVSEFYWVSCSEGARLWRSFKDPGIEEPICALKKGGREKEREETKSEVESNTSAYCDDSTEDCVDKTSAHEDERKIRGTGKELSFIFTMQS